LNAQIIGINHRSLHTFKLDMNRVIELAPQVAKDRIIIAASGLSSHEQIQKLRPYVNGFLIGSALSKSSHIDITIRELIFGSV
ncbi:bifunctional indole-3-glycerol phosphate synthase/phosphoribosylanthranilate isomerase, partial [Klebsiella pneumoniae]|nr:bifunctional indole-3-glycerol phosphate synthase/phosphoribosylanthranilate isomerase [Klebsiella pneumoniae]